MGLFSNQLLNVIEWNEDNENTIFYKWHNSEIKKGSHLIIRPGQDAIFLNSGRIEGIFKDEGNYDIETQIIPFLSTLKGFKFGFNSGMRAEVLFVNTKVFQTKWGTKGPINIPAQGMPGGLPIRANGTFSFCVKDYIKLIDNVAGVKSVYYVEDVKQRITAVIDQLLMKWISQVGKDMFNLQANSFDIAEGIKQDLNMKMFDTGITITDFNVMSFNYPENIQKVINQNAANSMIGDMGRYQQVAVANSMSNGTNSGSGVASDMVGVMMGMNAANQMINNMNASAAGTVPQQTAQDAGQVSGTVPVSAPKFCPNCGEKTTAAKFCTNCGYKLV